MAKKFDLAALMGAEEFNLDTMQVREIALGEIDENPDNTYAQQDIDELAESIEVVGLQQPLVVQAQENGRYLLLAGHRRRNALALLGRTSAPCIVSPMGLDPAKRTLILHWTNTMARGGAGLTGGNLTAAAKEIETALLDLKQRGAVELPGKLREYVAGLLQVSESALARAKVIDGHLDEVWQEDYNRNRINESVAYALSQCDAELQRELHGAYQEKPWHLDAKKVKAHQKAFAAKKAPLTCPAAEYRIEPCVGTDKRAAAVARGECPGCCHTCEKAQDCKWVCGTVSKRNRAHAEAEARAVQESERETAFRASEAGKAYLHVRETLERFGYSRDVTPEIRNRYSLQRLWFAALSGCHLPTLEDLGETADLIGISLQELLFGNPTPEGQALAALDAGLRGQRIDVWFSYPATRPAEGAEVIVSTKADRLRQVVYRGGAWFEPEIPDCELSLDVKYFTTCLPEEEENAQ